MMIETLLEGLESRLLSESYHLKPRGLGLPYKASPSLNGVVQQFLRPLITAPMGTLTYRYRDQYAMMDQTISIEGKLYVDYGYLDIFGVPNLRIEMAMFAPKGAQSRDKGGFRVLGHDVHWSNEHNVRVLLGSLRREEEELLLEGVETLAHSPLFKTLGFGPKFYDTGLLQGYAKCFINLWSQPIPKELL
jgi:hypothetical protein